LSESIAKNKWDTIGFSRMELQFPRYQQRASNLEDTTCFSLVEVQLFATTQPSEIL